MGYTNMEQFLGRIVPTFPNVTKVLHTGFSAGGFGAIATVELVGHAFPSLTDVILLSDSAPSVSLDYLPPCIQERKQTTWNFAATFLAECGTDCPDPVDYLFAYPQHLSRAYPDRRSGIIEAVGDSGITAGWGYTADDCALDDITEAPTPMDAAIFEEALLDFRAQMVAITPDGGTPNFGTFYLPGTQHGWLETSSSLYTASAGGERLIDWVTTLVNGGPVTNVGP